MSISQLSDNGYDIIFNQKSCKTVSQKDEFILFNDKSKNNIYKIKLSDLEKQNVKYLMPVNEEQWTWHRWLNHVSMRRISKLNKLDLVIDLPNLKFVLDALYATLEKQILKSFFQNKEGSFWIII